MLPFVLLPLTLSCGTPPLNAAQEAVPERAPSEGAPRSLRFGDPEELLYQEPYFPGASYDAKIPAPDAILGQAHGTRLAHHAEILACFRAWTGVSQRIAIETYGRTHEGRELVVAVITSPANHARLAAIRADLAALFDPRALADAEAERIVKETPAVAWMGYSIHGDELSGADASVAFAHHLIASTDSAVAELLERVVVVIDPCMNPDGRERIIGMVEQSAGYTPNLDYASMQRGRWPYGRGNHYLFDLNRDWMAGTQPETEGRWRIARSFHPQLFVDAHELFSLDTFLFYPQAPPINPALPPKLIEWQKRYALDAARAFDQRGWSYYTREWADAWAPFYSDSWGSLLGATGILYEQARTSGFPLRRASGEVITYRETVHHQAVMSLTNLETLAAHREEALRDYLAEQRRIVAADTPGNERLFVVEPGANADRIGEFLRILRGQGIEAFVARNPFEAKNVATALGERVESRAFPAGSILVPARQPQGRMVRAFLEFDQRMTADDLQREREDLERKNSSRIFDVTSWSLPLAFDLDAAWCDALEVERDPLPPAADVALEIVGAGPAVGWVVSGADDASVAFAARAMEHGLALNVADEELTVQSNEPLKVPRGSLLVRAAENPGERAAVEEKVLRAAREAQVARVHRLATGRSPDDTPDLGGTHLHLLVRPRVALLANSPVASDAYGHLWFELDSVLGVPFSLIDAQELGSTDLRRYNVLVLPPHDGGLGKLLAENADALKGWVRAGGTLIACANAAAELTSGKLGFSTVTLREHALEDLTPYRIAAEREEGARTIEIDEEAIWGDAEPKAAADPGTPPGDSAQPGAPAPEAKDPYAPVKIPEVKERWLARFSPAGATLRGLVDPEAWITSGAGAELPVFFYGSNVFLSKDPVRAAVRLPGAERLRLGGLVWPEARERIEHSAWLTVESVGNGQVILFAGMPAFRGFHRGTARLFANAVVFGPGLGASAPIGW